MALLAARFEAESSVDERIERLEEGVERLQADVTEMKSDIRRIDTKVDAVRDSVTALQVQMKDGFAAMVDRIAETERAIRVDFKADMEKGRAEFKADLAAARSEFRADLARDRADFKAEMAQQRGDFKAEMAELRGDHRKLLWAGVSACVFVLVAFASGYIRLDENISKLQVTVDRIAAAQSAP